MIQKTKINDWDSLNFKVEKKKLLTLNIDEKAWKGIRRIEKENKLVINISQVMNEKLLEFYEFLKLKYPDEIVKEIKSNGSEKKPSENEGSNSEGEIKS